MNEKTYGDTPAALLLVNELKLVQSIDQSSTASRSAGKRITTTNSHVKELTDALTNGFLSPSVVANSLRLMRKELSEQFLMNYWEKLVRNIQIGSIKAAMRLCFVQRRVDVAFKNSDGYKNEYCDQLESYIDGKMLEISEDCLMNGTIKKQYYLSEVNDATVKNLKIKSDRRHAIVASNLKHSQSDVIESMVPNLRFNRDVVRQKDTNTGDVVSNILLWHKTAVPNPTIDNKRIAQGVHFEEVSEHLEAIGFKNTKGFDNVKKLADGLKTNEISVADGSIDRKELLDSLCDQIVTAIGVANAYGLDILSGLKEVNSSNWSKFDENGNPIFNEHGKIAKGPSYKKPNLEGMY